MNCMSTLNENRKNKPCMIFNCSKDNDLYSVLSNMGHLLTRYDSLYDALDNAPDGAGVLVLADGHPIHRLRSWIQYMEGYYKQPPYDRV